MRLFKSLAGLAKISLSVFSFLKKPLFWLAGKTWNYFLKPISLGIYKIYLSIKKGVTEIHNPATGKIISALTNRYVIHVVIIVLAIFVMVNNINAKETRDETFGEKSILYSLARQDTLGTMEESYLIEETGIVPEDTNANKPLSYMDAALGVKSQLRPTEIVIEEIINEEAGIATAQGGGALIKPQISSTKLNTGQRDEPIEYIVQEGDTVSTIAQDFGVSTNTILWENNLSAYSYIRPGDKLTILPTTGISYTVKSGDTVESIAKKYNTEADKIITFNKLADASDINSGQKLILPDGRPYSAPVPATSTWSVRNVVVPPSSVVSSGGRMVWPTSWKTITQYFSWRHTGLDVDGDYNSPIYASDSGIVESSGWYDGYGLQILINHGNGIKTRYAHASKIFVSVGQRVSRGQTIAMVGTTGRSTGTHLHFEVIVNGRKLNPLSYIR